MTKYEFIFSKKPRNRIARHFCFWLIYCIYFFIQSLPPQKFQEFFIRRTYFIALMNLSFFGPVLISLVYFFIYYLLPKTIRKRKYGLFFIWFIASYIAGSFINYFLAEKFLITTGYFPNTFEHRIEMGNFNTRWGMIIATIALGIKLSKDWYLQQKENLEILQKKSRSEMQLEKARLHPELLLTSLDSINKHVEADQDNSATMIMKLSELLSYMLYESEIEFISLEKELAELKNLIYLNCADDKNHAAILLQVEGIISNKVVKPMLFVKLVEESISLLNKECSSNCQLRIYVTSSEQNIFFEMTFFGISKEITQSMQWHSLIEKTRNHLKEDYRTDEYEINADAQIEASSIHLKLISKNAAKTNSHNTTIKTISVYDRA